MARQFWAVFLGIAVLWSSVSVFGCAGGVIVSVLLCGTGVALSLSRYILASFLYVLLLMLLPAIVPFVMTARADARRMECAMNLKSIALALRSYHNVYGCLPPAVLADKSGKPAHSWRVLILPYLGGAAASVYKSYRFDQPWNGPNNRQLVEKLPRLFRCPADPEAALSDMTSTSYVAVTGLRTAWPPGASSKFADLSSHEGDTILVAETSESKIHWMEPRDLTIEEACRGVNRGSGPGISSDHRKRGRIFVHDQCGAQAAFIDGTVHFLPDEISPETLTALLTCDATKRVKVAEIDREKPNWQRILGSVGLVLATILFLFTPWKKGSVWHALPRPVATCSADKMAGRSP
jgi:hypothetical protein